MKRFLTALLSLLVLAAPLASIFDVKAAPGPNLINNSSVEIVDSSNPNTPAEWKSNQWGTLDSVFTYPAPGYHESRSVRVDVSNYQSGDAKWYFEPVEVQAGKNYTYSTFYNASASSEIVMQLKDNGGNFSYQWLKTVAPNTDGFRQSTASFTVPANIVSATVFHVLNSNGYLQTDNFFFGLTDETPLPPPTGDNLIPNQSMESPDALNPFKPAYWSNNSWGDNTAVFDYHLNENGNMSVRTEVTRFQSGDAKWHFEPVVIEGGQTYSFKELYKSNVTTEFVMAYIDANGVWSYQWLQSVPTSTTWKELAVDFTAPQSAKKTTVFHVVNKVGWLQIDNARLTKHAPSSNPIPNPSLETASGTAPAGWSNNNWGTNSASFDYVNNGHTGSKSVKVTVSNFQSGDAKWFFNPISLTPGAQYRFSAWYKGSVAPEAVAMYIKADGSEQYFGMPKPLSVSATQWQQYTDTFTVPQDAVAVSVFLYVNKNGWIQTDDYQISGYTPVGFNRPLVTLTFDDGEEDNVSTALPILNSYGFKTTQCFATEHIEGNQTQVNRVLQFKNSGHEVCSHTVSHPFLTTLNTGDLDYELRHSKEYLESITGQTVRNFASPYGDYNANVNNVIDNYYRSHRTVDEGFNSKDNFNIYRLRVQNILDTTTAAQVNIWLDQAAESNTWLILVYHRVASNPGPYDTNASNFQAHMAALKASGISVKTYNDALDEVLSQL